MKAKHLVRIFIGLFLITISFSCGGSGGDIVDSLIPDLSAGWKNQNDTVHDDEYFFFQVDSVGKAYSTFSGNENPDFTGAGTTHSFSGSYQNSKINFTFTEGPKSGQKYSGTIKGTAPNAIMTLTTPTGTITLEQHF